ncbi:MAG: tRNA (cytidine(34)-2'-O)-methyltransferase [Alphaproteobacteria bacterium]|nr:tRNA (cytidine(34)-2'-O)-methyltransferase [Alphaproteobacteria bacterium]
MRIALYQPDIPQNVGAMIRLCACMGAGLDIIEPCGFPWDERKIRQAGMDYVGQLVYERHTSWNAFQSVRTVNRIILMTTQGLLPYTDFIFKDTDILLAGRESAGVPQDIHDSADERIIIPMQEGLRSLNIVNASAMILGEALRQTRWL